MKEEPIPFLVCTSTTEKVDARAYSRTQRTVKFSRFSRITAVPRKFYPANFLRTCKRNTICGRGHMPVHARSTAIDCVPLALVPTAAVGIGASTSTQRL